VRVIPEKEKLLVIDPKTDNNEQGNSGWEVNLKNCTINNLCPKGTCSTSNI